MLAAEVYAKGLSHLRHGLPLWIPEPADGGAILIGDVGYILDGRFYRLFNATQPRDNPINAGEVPPKFEVLPTNPKTMHRVEELFPPGSALCSQSVRKVDVSIGAAADSTYAGLGAAYRFSCNAEQGALLLLKDHATAQQIHPSSPHFINYMRKNYQNWCKFARDTRGLALEPEQLVLVRGWVKTTEWAVAAFLHGGSEQELSFQAEAGSFAKAKFSVAVSRDHATSVLHRSGPRRTIASDGGAASQPPQDQCVFLSYFKLKRSPLFKLRMKIVAAAEPKDDRQHTPPTDGESHDASELDEGSLSPSSEFDVRADSEDLPPWDPLDDVLDYINLTSGADIAVASHCSLRELEWPLDNDVKSALQRLRPPIQVHSTGVATLKAEGVEFDSPSPMDQRSSGYPANQPRDSPVMMAPLPFSEGAIRRRSSDIHVPQAKVEPSMPPRLKPRDSKAPSRRAFGSRASRSTSERRLLSQLRDQVFHAIFLMGRLELSYLVPPTDPARTKAMLSARDLSEDDDDGDFVMAALSPGSDYHSSTAMACAYSGTPSQPPGQAGQRQIPQDPNVPPDTFNPQQPLYAGLPHEFNFLDRETPGIPEEELNMSRGRDFALERERDGEQKVPDVTDEGQPPHDSSQGPQAMRLTMQLPFSRLSNTPHHELETMRYTSTPDALPPIPPHSRLDYESDSYDDPTSWKSAGWDAHGMDSEPESGSELQLNATGPIDDSLVYTTPACQRCKGLKVKCQFDTTSNTCQRCLNGGHECITPGRSVRETPPLRECLRSQLRQQIEGFNTLISELDDIRHRTDGSSLGSSHVQATRPAFVSLLEALEGGLARESSWHDSEDDLHTEEPTNLDESGLDLLRKARASLEAFERSIRLESIQPVDTEDVAGWRTDHDDTDEGAGSIACLEEASGVPVSSNSGQAEGSRDSGWGLADASKRSRSSSVEDGDQTADPSPGAVVYKRRRMS